MSDHMSTKRADPGKTKDDRKKQPSNTNADTRERTTRDREGGTGPNNYGSEREKFKAELDVLEKAYRAYDVVKLRDYAKNHTEKFVRDQANYWLNSTPVSDYILITETYRNDLEALKRLRDKPQQSAYNKEIAQNRINILEAQDPSAKTTRGRDNNSNTEEDQQAQDDEEARQQEREDQKEEQDQRDGDNPAAPQNDPAVAMMQESDPNAAPPMAPPPPNPNIPVRGGVSGGPTRRQRYADLMYPSEFFPDREKFDEVFRYAVRNPYSYAHPYLKKPEMINIVENRRNFLSLK